MSRYIRHLTIDTGHTRDSYGDEVPPDIRDRLRPLIDCALAGERVQIPGDIDPPGCTMTGARGRARGIVLSILAPPSAIPLVMIGIAPVTLASRDVWSALTCDLSSAGEPPSAPYCAVRLYETAALVPEAMSWLGDLERCLAWAWVD